MVKVPGLSRLGLDHLASDHWHSLSLVDEPAGTIQLSWSDVAVFFGVPAGVGVAAFAAGAELQSLGELLAGTAILTGLLFGLLTHVLGLGLRLYDDPRRTRSSRIVILTDELRANVSYAIGVGILLTGSLMLIAAFTKPTTAGYAPWLTALVLALLVHLLLTLLMILKRVRSTYKQLAN